MSIIIIRLQLLQHPDRIFGQLLATAAALRGPNSRIYLQMAAGGAGWHPTTARP
jgi:hypothetical protein